jgi:hypothetical protein
MILFLYTVALTAVTKAETLLLRLRAMPKTRDSAPCITAQSHLYLRISLRIRNYMQTRFNPLISDRGRIVDEKKRGSKIS